MHDSSSIWWKAQKAKMQAFRTPLFTIEFGSASTFSTFGSSFRVQVPNTAASSSYFMIHCPTFLRYVVKPASARRHRLVWRSSFGGAQYCARVWSRDSRLHEPERLFRREPQGLSQCPGQVCQGKAPIDRVAVHWYVDNEREIAQLC